MSNKTSLPNGIDKVQDTVMDRTTYVLRHTKETVADVSPDTFRNGDWWARINQPETGRPIFLGRHFSRVSATLAVENILPYIY